MSWSFSLSPNITLSSTQSSITSPALLPYIPPHPQKGTPYHRYTLLLLAHPIDPATGKSSPIEIAAESIERDGVDVRALMHEHKFVPKGITFFRQVWDSTVTAIYEQHLGSFNSLTATPSWTVLTSFASA